MRALSLLTGLGLSVAVLSCDQVPTRPEPGSAPRLFLAESAPPPAPVPTSPPDGARREQPIRLAWNAVTASTPIIAYNWEVALDAGFASVVAWGSTFDFGPNGPPDAPSPLSDRVSGLADGTYYWRVQAVEEGAPETGPVQGDWSATRTFIVTGPGNRAPGSPRIREPEDGTQFHPFEWLVVEWNGRGGADHYLFEYDDEPTFSRPLLNATFDRIEDEELPVSFGDFVGTVYYRVVAVSRDGIRSLPSPTRTAVIRYDAPIPDAPRLRSPNDGARVRLPVRLDWEDVENPFSAIYEVEIATEPTFAAPEFFTIGISESRLTVESLTPGRQYWRVRSYNGESAPGVAAVTEWSRVGSFVVR